MNDAKAIRIENAEDAQEDPWSTLRWKTSEPFPRDNTAFMMWLTPIEWRLCYALSFAWNLEGELDGNLSMSEQFRAVIHRLQHVYRYPWNAICVDNDQKMWFYQERPVSTDNFNWIAMMGSRKPSLWPSYLENVRASLDYCHERDELQDLCSLLEKTMEKVMTDDERTKMQFQAKLHEDPEFLKDIRDEAQRKVEIMKELGMIQSDMVH